MHVGSISVNLSACWHLHCEHFMPESLGLRRLRISRYAVGIGEAAEAEATCSSCAECSAKAAGLFRNHWLLAEICHA